MVTDFSRVAAQTTCRCPKCLNTCTSGRALEFGNKCPYCGSEEVHPLHPNAEAALTVSPLGMERALCEGCAMPIDPETLCCTECGIEHGDTLCPGCGRRGVHVDGCTEVGHVI